MSSEELPNAVQIVIMERYGEFRKGPRNPRIELRLSHEPVITGEKRLIDTDRNQIASRVGTRKFHCGRRNV